MADATYQPGVYRKQGGDELVVSTGGTLTVEGTTDSVSLTNTGAAYQWLPATTDTGAFNYGNGTTDVDVKIFLGSISNWAEFDVSAKNFETKNLQLKFHNHDTVNTYAMELKYDFQATTGTAYGVDCVCEIEPGGGTPANRTSGQLLGIHGVARLQAGFTAVTTNGDDGDKGIMGELVNLGSYTGTAWAVHAGMSTRLHGSGTWNGSGIHATAFYANVNATSGTWTAVDSLTVARFTSNATVTVSSGNKWLVAILNMGSTTWDAGIRIDTASGAITAGISIGVCTYAANIDADVPDLLNLTAGSAGTSCVFTNAATPAVNTSHALRVQIGGSPHYIPVFSDLSWGS